MLREPPPSLVRRCRSSPPRRPRLVLPRCRARHHRSVRLTPLLLGLRSLLLRLLVSLMLPPHRRARRRSLGTQTSSPTMWSGTRPGRLLERRHPPVRCLGARRARHLLQGTPRLLGPRPAYFPSGAMFQARPLTQPPQPERWRSAPMLRVIPPPQVRLVVSSISQRRHRVRPSFWGRCPPTRRLQHTSPDPRPSSEQQLVCSPPQRRPRGQRPSLVLLRVPLLSQRRLRAQRPPRRWAPPCARYLRRSQRRPRCPGCQARCFLLLEVSSAELRKPQPMFPARLPP